MKLLRGENLANKILTKIKKDLQRKKIKPDLAVILVGENKASETYVRLKQKAAKKVGINFRLIKYGEKTSQQKIISCIKKLNNDKKVVGIIVQLPLPKNINPKEVISSIDPDKDVDGFHPINVTAFLKSTARIHPVFPKAIVRLLKSSKISLDGKNAIVIANSHEFGETMTTALKNKNLDADYFLTKSLKNNLDKLKKADIVVTAIGKPNFIKGDMLKNGVVVIDGGISNVKDKIFGDVDRDSVKNVASFLSPVPGGVGPVTIACLLENVSLLSLNSR